jgi:hypothetical protein
MSKTRRICAPVAIVGVLVGALGCATDESATAPAQRPSYDGRWEAVTLPDRTAAELGDASGAWWEYRRDSVAGVREDGPILAVNQWPEPERPSLNNPRYIYVPKQPETMLRFDTYSAWRWR